METPKKLKLFNGRGHPGIGHPEWERGHHFYIAAHSRADAANILAEVCGRPASGWEYELRVYYSAGSWGNAMVGVIPERGLWVRKEPAGEPFRAYPLKTPESSSPPPTK